MFKPDEFGKEAGITSTCMLGCQQLQDVFENDGSIERLSGEWKHLDMARGQGRNIWVVPKTIGSSGGTLNIEDLEANAKTLLKYREDRSV